MALLLGTFNRPPSLAVRHAAIDNTPQCATMIARILRRTPDAGDTKLATATLRVVVRTINPPPRMTATDFDAPTLRFSVTECFLDFFLRMGGPTHRRLPLWAMADKVVN
jgi:hypothetical protein